MRAWSCSGFTPVNQRFLSYSVVYSGNSDTTEQIGFKMGQKRAELGLDQRQVSFRPSSSRPSDRRAFSFIYSDLLAVSTGPLGCEC